MALRRGLSPEGTPCWESESQGMWLLSRSIMREKYARLTGASDDDLVDRVRSQQVCPHWSSKPPYYYIPGNRHTDNHKAQPQRTSPECFRSTEHYYWKPASQGRMCIEEVDKKHFCAVMKAAGMRRISFVGDSMTRSMAMSLWNLLGDRKLSHNAAYSCHGWRGCSRWCPCGQILNASDDVVEIHQAPSLNHISQNLSLIEDTMRGSELTVINFGAHYTPRHFNDTQTAREAFATDLQELAKIVRRVKVDDPAKILVYRSTPPGHPHCDKHVRQPPAAPGSEEERQLSAEWLASMTREPYESFGWHLFAGFDRLARQTLGQKSANGGAALMQWLDVTPMSKMRPDAHTAFRHDGGKLPPDCMHFTLPGVPDSWNKLLLSAIARCTLQPRFQLSQDGAFRVGLSPRSSSPNSTMVVSSRPHCGPLPSSSS